MFGALPNLRGYKMLQAQISCLEQALQPFEANCRPPNQLGFLSRPMFFLRHRLKATTLAFEALGCVRSIESFVISFAMSFGSLRSVSSFRCRETTQQLPFFLVIQVLQAKVVPWTSLFSEDSNKMCHPSETNMMPNPSYRWKTSSYSAFCIFLC